MIKVMIVDDQVLLRNSIGHIINSYDDIEVTDLVGTGQEAIDACLNNKPDIILMDIEMPKMSGITVARIIKEKYRDIKIIMLTTFDNTDNITNAFLGGADGYIVKDIGYKELVSTIRCVSNGLTVIHESVKQIMIEKFKKIIEQNSSYVEKMGAEEIEIVRFIVMGKSNKEIGEELNYSEGTVKNRVSKIFEKLGLKDRMQLAIYAVENGIV